MDFDCCIKGNSFYQFKEHFEKSDQTETILEGLLFKGQAEPGMFTRSHLKAWQEYMKQLRTKYSSPDLFRYKLSLMGLEGSEALDMAWDPKKTQAVYKQLKQANQLE